LENAGAVLICGSNDSTHANQAISNIAVDVVNLKLEFNADFTTEGTTGLRFTKTRQVVIDAAGKVVAITGDGKTEAPMVAI